MVLGGEGWKERESCSADALLFRLKTGTSLLFWKGIRNKGEIVCGTPCTGPEIQLRHLELTNYNSPTIMTTFFVPRVHSMVRLGGLHSLRCNLFDANTVI